MPRELALYCRCTHSKFNCSHHDPEKNIFSIYVIVEIPVERRWDLVRELLGAKRSIVFIWANNCARTEVPVVVGLEIKFW